MRSLSSIRDTLVLRNFQRSARSGITHRDAFTNILLIADISVS